MQCFSDSQMLLLSLSKLCFHVHRTMQNAHNKKLTLAVSKENYIISIRNRAKTTRTICRLAVSAANPNAKPPEISAGSRFRHGRVGVHVVHRQPTGLCQFAQVVSAQLLSARANVFTQSGSGAVCFRREGNFGALAAQLGDEGERPVWVILCNVIAN